MNLEDKKAQLKSRIANLSALEIELKSLEGKTQPTDKELHTDISSFFSVSESHGEYNYILGGDGRSQPWDERRTGNIATVTINKDYYLSESQTGSIRLHVKAIHNPNHIIIKTT